MKKNTILIILLIVAILALWFDIFLRLRKDNNIITQDPGITQEPTTTQEPSTQEPITQGPETPSIYTWETTTTKSETNTELNVLTSIDDDVTDNSLWCGTFQLVWNDMVNNVVKQDVVFSPQLKDVENLNKQTFSEKYLSYNSYYTKFWLLTLDLKDEIEKWIREKFNETSDILDQLDWSNVPQSDEDYDSMDTKRYWFYAMLKKIFNFKTAFDELSMWSFDGKYDNIEYFGINWKSNEILYDQVHVYYYNSNDDFAVALKTNEWEEIILAVWIEGNSFMKMYSNLIRNESAYGWNHYFTEYDYLQVPNLQTKTLVEFKNLENKDFFAKDGKWYFIGKALQAIEFELNKSWWYIKSEAWIEMTENAMLIEKIEHRYFKFDKPFVMFWKEADKTLPYFAAKISDITLFQ